eukprot:scaffold4017_cov140-Isochrysis_galbana.AAC.7
MIGFVTPFGGFVALPHPPACPPRARNQKRQVRRLLPRGPRMRPRRCQLPCRAHVAQDRVEELLTPLHPLERDWQLLLPLVGGPWLSSALNAAPHLSVRAQLHPGSGASLVPPIKKALSIFSVRALV